MTKKDANPRAQMEQDLRLVRSIARRTKRRFRLRVDLEDMEQAGAVALIEARKRFDPTTGVPFDAFAYRRIQGAIIDSIGAMTGCTRGQLRNARATATAHILAEDADVAYAGRTDPAADAGYLELVVSGTLHATEISDQLAALDLNDSGSEDGLQPHRSNPEIFTAKKLERERVRAAIDALPEVDRRVIHGHYFHGRSLKRIAEAENHSASWACRVHLRALNRLRSSLNEEPAAAPVRQPLMELRG